MSLQAALQPARFRAAPGTIRRSGEDVAVRGATANRTFAGPTDTMWVCAPTARLVTKTWCLELARSDGRVRARGLCNILLGSLVDEGLVAGGAEVTERELVQAPGVVPTLDVVEHGPA